MNLALLRTPHFVKVLRPVGHAIVQGAQYRFLGAAPLPASFELVGDFGGGTADIVAGAARLPVGSDRSGVPVFIFVAGLHGAIEDCFHLGGCDLPGVDISLCLDMVRPVPHPLLADG
jgi:hypothetical protein